jgi:hypothetical protein
MTSRIGLLALAGAVALGCVTKGPESKTPGTLTAADHEAAARKAERRAEENERRVDPGSYSIQRCAPVVVPPPTAQVAPQSGPSFSRPEDVCGNATISAMRDHQREAEQERAIAAEHRAVAAELRRAEEIACADVPPELRAQNPFSRAGEVLAVAPVADRSETGKAASSRSGVVLALQRTNEDPKALEGRLNCQAAMAATDAQPELSNSPAAVPGAKASVWEDNGQLMVEISSTDRDAASEINRRARALISDDRYREPSRY